MADNTERLHECPECESESFESNRELEVHLAFEHNQVLL